MIEVSPHPRWIQFGPYRVDLRARELSKHGTRIKLQARPFEILTMLLERPGEVVTRNEIRTRLWPEGTFVDFDNNISTAVRKLRDALCDSAASPLYIETVGRVGYRFVAQIESMTAQAPFAAERSTPGRASVESMASLAVFTPAASASTESLEESQTTVNGASSQFAPLAAPRFAGGWRSQYPVLVVSILLCVGLAIPAVRWGRQWLASVITPGKADHKVLHSAEHAAKEYAIGRDVWSRRGANSLINSIEHFRLALEYKPDYGLAYSGLADAYILLPFYSGFPATEAYAKAKAAAIRAVQLAPRSAEAHTSLAYVKFYVDWDFTGAEEEFQLALQQNPNYVTAIQWYAEYLSLIGRYSAAIAEIKRALQLMPDLPVMHHNTAQIYQTARHYDEAITEYRITIHMDPAFATSYANMALAYMRKGMYQEAIEVQMEEATAVGDATQSAVARRLANAYQSGGRDGYLREVVALKMEENPDRDSYRIAQCYALLGQRELAFEYLDRAYQLHSFELLAMNSDPELDALRSDPRFLVLRRRVGLPLPPFEF